MSLVLDQFKVTYPEPDGRLRTVLSIGHLAVPQGSQICLYGGSGSGKTTLLNAIAGIIRPSGGRVLHGDCDLSRLSESGRDRFRARHIGYVFQTFNLLQSLSARENVALAGSLAGMSARGARQRADALLERVGLSARSHARPPQLSVGEQQRTAIARAIMNQPRLLIADEPTANLDPENGQVVIDLLLEVATEARATLLLVTHQPEVRARFKDVRNLAELGS